MTEAERVNNAMTLAGQRGYNGLLAILNATDEDYASLANSINNCTGAASRMAAVKLDNLNGQLTLMNSAWDALKTTIGEQCIPEMRGLYEIGTDVFSGINDFVKANPGVVKGIVATAAVIGTVTAAVTAFTAAAKLAAAATSLVPGASQIMAVTAAVAGVVGVMTALSSMQDTEVTKVRKLTEVSRQEYEQIQKLKAEYEEVAATYGETSNQAVYLAWRIDELTESYQNSKQTLEDYVAECDALNDSLRADLSAIRETFDSIDNNEGTTLALVHRLQQLASQTEQTVGTQEEMKAIIKELNEVVPDLALNYDDVINGVTDYGEAIEAAVKAQAAMERYQAAQKSMVEAYNAQYTAQQRLDEIEGERAAAQERYNNAYAAYRALVDSIQKDARNASSIVSSSEQYAEWKAAQNALDSYNSLWDEYTAILREATEAYDMCRDELVDYIEAMNDAAGSSGDLKYAVEGVMERVQSLAKAYEEAYDAAYSSISGQYALWDEVKEAVATDADSINRAMESQIDYWQKYNANLEALGERTGDIEGLSDLIANFADGSTDSVNAIAGMAKASDDDLQAMVENWKLLQEEQEAAAGSIADLKTDFTETMDQLQQELVEDIKAMDLGVSAAASGEATIQGYINGVNAMLPQVQAAYAEVAAAAINALNGSYGAGGTAHQRAKVNEIMWQRDLLLDGYYVAAYASGTENAAPGWAMVGENGPELMFFNGGEKVLSATQTSALQAKAQPTLSAVLAPSGGSDAPRQISVPVSIQVSGNATQDTVEALREYGDELAETVTERVMDALEQERIDAARRAFL